MIEGIYRIGTIQEEKDFLEEYIEDIGKNYKHVFKIVIDISDEEKFKYERIDYEEFDFTKKMRYFYKKGSARGTDKTPTSKVTEVNKTLTKKIFPVFKKILEDNKKILNKDEKSFLKKFDNVFKEDKARIQSDVISYLKDIGCYQEKNGEISIKDNGIITVVFKKENDIFYVGDMEIFKNLFKNNEKEAYKDYYYSKSNKVYSFAKNKKCYICGETSEEVWGFVNTYNFYTVDKESYVAGGFDRSIAWKNYPVCQKCAKILNKGKKYANENLIFNFCGFNYYLIPELVIFNEDLLKSVLDKLKKYRDFSLQEKEASLIENVEEAILRELAKERNLVNFNFLFFEKSNAAFKILLYMQEVPPTRLKYLISAKDDVDFQERKYDIFKELKTKKNNISLNFSFGFIREFFPRSKKDGKFDKYFLSILNNIFIGKKISSDLLFSRFMEKISQEFLNENWLEPWVLKAYKILVYLEKIKILERRKGYMKNYVNEYEDFFDENLLFDDDVKKALFLEGVLVQKLLKIQYQERNATPFRNRLNGLKIDEKIAKRILPEAINKLEEYGKNYYRKLEEAIGIYLLNADFKKYSIDEMSFYFTLGMILEKHFKNEDNNKDKNYTTKEE